MLASCYQSQNYKIWKQFTTSSILNFIVSMLLSITKLQNLRAIHNGLFYRNYLYFVVINHKTTKFESNSQPREAIKSRTFCCYQSQNNKIWKQFTTRTQVLCRMQALLSITKLQNLKAIHNIWLQSFIPCCVVINRKVTKFESNSQ